MAETLITLGVIGVVSAITIPQLIAKYNETVTVIKVKETYSLMNQAYKLWAEENDCFDNVMCFTDDNYLKRFTYYLKAMDVVYRGQNRANKIWLSDNPPLHLDGSNADNRTWVGVNKKNARANVFYFLMELL